MMRKILVFCLAFVMILMTSCNLPQQGTPQSNGVDTIRTSAARTLDAVSTTMASPKGTPGTVVASSSPESQKTLVVTLRPSVTPDLATATKGTTLPCDQATFVRDISVPDGTLLFPGTPFTKTWELKNTGSCPWNSTYLLVFANEGDLMGATISQPMMTSGAVQPGELVKVSVNLTAPNKLGDAKSYWRLRNPAGVDFGPAGKSFWAAIKVVDKFQPQDNLCGATWSNGSADIPCPSKMGDARGDVSLLNNPVFANGYQDDEPAIQLEPQQTNDGQIVGKFPPYVVNSTMPLLKAIIGCGANAKACDAKVALTSQVGNEPEQTLGEWNVVFSKEWASVKIDMAAKGLVGKAVVLRIYVRANGAANQDRVLVLGPVFAAP
jgi:hypothetical protein